MTERETCEHCQSTFKTKFVLKTHINTNKKCLALRGLSLKTDFICDGCKSMFITMNHLSTHQVSCKEYQQFSIDKKHHQELEQQQKKHQQELEQQQKRHKQELEKQQKKHKQELDNKYLEYKKKLDEAQLCYKEELNKQEQRFVQLKNLYETLQEQYTEVKEEYKVRQNKFDSVLERLAVDAVNKPSSSTTNNTVNNIRNVLSSTYTLEKLDENELIEDMRKNYTENQFKKGQKGLAEYLFKNKLKTPDDKLMICCSDKSRKKFKILDSFGNIKEDIEARFLCEKIKGPVRLVSTEIFEKIRDNLCRQQENEELSDGQQTRLINDMEKVGEDFINIYKFDEHESNGEFINELSVLLHV